MGSPSNNKIDCRSREGGKREGELGNGEGGRDGIFCVLAKRKKSVLRIWDPGSGAGCPLDPGWKKSESGVNIPDHISENLVTIF